MGTNSEFEIEENDIVKLLPSHDRASTSGWVNVGVHAIYISLSLDGNLLVESYARGAENKAVASLFVHKVEAVRNGGIDCDADAADGVYPITVDGLDYTVHVSENGAELEVVDTALQTVAKAQHDSSFETLSARFFDHTGHIRDHDASQRDLYDKPWREVATWLCTAHPNV